MEREIQDLETRLKALQNEGQILTRNVEVIRMEKRKDLVEELNRQRRSNEKLAEIRTWERASTKRSDQQHTTPKEATPPRQTWPSPPEGLVTSNTRRTTPPRKTSSEETPTLDKSPEQRPEASPPTNRVSKPPKIEKRTKATSGTLYKTQPEGSEAKRHAQRTTREVKAQREKRESARKQLASPNTSQAEQTESSTVGTAHQRARMIADSDSEESITMELDPKLSMLPVVTLNRLEKVNPSAILEERTRIKKIKDV